MVTVGGIPNQTKDVKNHDVKANRRVLRKKKDAGMGNKYLNVICREDILGRTRRSVKMFTCQNEY